LFLYIIVAVKQTRWFGTSVNVLGLACGPLCRQAHVSDDRCACIDRGSRRAVKATHGQDGNREGHNHPVVSTVKGWSDSHVVQGWRRVVLVGFSLRH